MIEIFKTNISRKDAGKLVLAAIKNQFPGVAATIDLDDTDKVLRVVGAWAPVSATEVISLVKSMGFECELLDD